MMYLWGHVGFRFLELATSRHLKSKESSMKNPLDVLRMKEEEIQRVKKEIEALQITARLLSESEESRDKRSEYRQLLQMP